MSDLRVCDDGRIRLITFDRPENRNAFTRGLLVDLEEALANPRGALAAIITGTGGFFSAGADLNEVEGSERDIEFDEAVSRVAEAARSSRIPVIAAIEGGCLGAAFDFSMACDVRVVSRSAFFALPAVRLGLLYNPSSIARMQHEIGPTALARILLMDDKVRGEEALSLGLASVLTEDGETLDRARTLAEQVVSCDPAAVAATKQLLRDLFLQPSTERWESIRRKLVSSEFRRAALWNHPARKYDESVSSD